MGPKDQGSSQYPVDVDVFSPLNEKQKHLEIGPLQQKETKSSPNYVQLLTFEIERVFRLGCLP